MRPEKQAIVDDLKQRVGDAEFTLLLDYQGLTVDEMMALRCQMTENDASLRVAKNTFVKVALADLEKPSVDGLLSGPTAVVAGDGDVALLLKKLLAFAKDHDALEVKGGILGSDVLGASDVEIMSKLPSREALLGSLVGTIAAPMSGLVGVMSQKLLSLVYVLKAVEEKKSNA